MPGYLTTHVLDTARGQPADGLKVELFRIEHGHREQRGERITNADGRTDGPLLPEAVFALGTYELVFHVGDYLASKGIGGGFLDIVPIRFSMTEATHYHVPLLLSPFGYSTYRGS